MPNSVLDRSRELLARRKLPSTGVDVMNNDANRDPWYVRAFSAGKRLRPDRPCLSQSCSATGTFPTDNGGLIAGPVPHIGEDTKNRLTALCSLATVARICFGRSGTAEED